MQDKCRNALWHLPAKARYFSFVPSNIQVVLNVELNVAEWGTVVSHSAVNYVICHTVGCTV